MSRYNTRQTPRPTSTTPDPFALHLTNAERIVELLTFDRWTLATVADDRRAQAAQLAECNRFLMEEINKI